MYKLDVDQESFNELMGCLVKRRRKVGLLVNKKPRALSLRVVHRGDRLEPAAEGLPDLLHGDKINEFPHHLRKVLLIRRPTHFPYMFIWRLFCIPKFFRGIPGL